MRLSRTVVMLVGVMLGIWGCGQDSASDVPAADCDLEDETCIPVLCSNGIADPIETDLDCGGVCGPCELGELCLNPDDCRTGFCLGLRCSDPNAPQPECREHDDCSSRVCEDGVCQAPSCDDDVANGDETGRDCGGRCEPCATGVGCSGDMDCQTGNCIQNVCRATRCGNGIQDAAEVCDDGNTRDGDNCSADCQMVTCVVGGDLASLAAGLESDCERITLGEGVFEGDVVVTRPVQIFGAGADKSVVRGDGSGPVITVRSSGVSLGYISVEGGLATEGGGVLQDGGTLTLQYMQVKGNRATTRGGGVFSQNGVLSILTTTITQNSVLTSDVGCGGGIAVMGGSADVEDLVIEGNFVRAQVPGASVRGGGLCLTSMRLGAEKLQVNHNALQLDFTESGQATAEGAGMWTNDSETLIIGGSNWEGNGVDVLAPFGDVRVRGGVMYVLGGPHILDTGTVSSTSVALNVMNGEVEGGTLWTDATSWDMFNMTFDGLNILGATSIFGGTIYAASAMDLNRVWMRNMALGGVSTMGAAAYFVADAKQFEVNILSSEFTNVASEDASSAIHALARNGGTLNVNLSQSAVIRAGNSGMVLDAQNGSDSVVCTVSNSTLGDLASTALSLEGSGSSVARLLSTTIANVDVGVSMDGETSLLQVANSIVDANISCAINSGTMLSRGFNLYGGTGCVATTNDLEASALLTAAAYVDSETQTYAPQMFSLAVNAGNPAGCAGADGTILLADQRNKPRTDARCDIGAHELP